MKNINYLLSIIIPTKNRQQYAAKAVEQVLSIKSDKIQLVIQDNSDNDSLNTLIYKYRKDKRLKYNYTNKLLSFVDNFSEGISLADGEYICIVGDDDGIMPNILCITEWAKKNSVDAIAPNINVVYFWPSSKNIVKNSQIGYMYMSYINDKVSLCDTKQAVKKLMSYGGQKYLSTDMVKLYHGVVKKSCVDKIKDVTGRYLGGLSPDIYAAVALSLVTDKVVKINYPITISGICQTSSSADSAIGKHTGELKDAPHLKGQTSYEWSNEVPAFYSVETIWADSALRALKDFDAIEYYQKFNIAALNMYCVKKYPLYKNIIVEHSKKFNIKSTYILWEKLRLPGFDFIKRVQRRLARKKGDVIKDYNIKNILVAEKLVEEHLKDLKMDINSVLRHLDALL